MFTLCSETEYIFTDSSALHLTGMLFIPWPYVMPPYHTFDGIRECNVDSTSCLDHDLATVRRFDDVESTRLRCRPDPVHAEDLWATPCTCVPGNAVVKVLDLGHEFSRVRYPLVPAADGSVPVEGYIRTSLLRRPRR